MQNHQRGLKRQKIYLQASNTAARLKAISGSSGASEDAILNQMLVIVKHICYITTLGGAKQGLVLILGK